jgi:hypothetical protein
MTTLATIPATAVYYAKKNFYNDVNGNPRIFYPLFDKDMKYLGDCEDNYAGNNFTYGRNLQYLALHVGKQNGIRAYRAQIPQLFKNEGLK